MDNYPAAIAWFEDVISNPPSEIDSMYAVIDLAYTYLQMQYDNKNRHYTGKFPQYRYNNYEDFLTMREKMIKSILSITGELPITQSYVLSLEQNYPNPFNPNTTICFTLDKDYKCNLSIYNVKGQKVKVLVNETKTKGSHKVIWDGKDQNNKIVSSGLYFYRLETKDKCITNKMILLK